MDIVKQLAVGVCVVLVTLVLSWVIVNVLYDVEERLRHAGRRLRCLGGHHGWITVSHAYIGWETHEPVYRYRVCGTCRRREDLDPEVR